MWVNSSFTEFMHATVGHYLLQVFETTKDSNSSGRGPVVRRQITDCLCLQLLKSLGRQLSRWSSDRCAGDRASRYTPSAGSRDWGWVEATGDEWRGGGGFHFLLLVGREQARKRLFWRFWMKPDSCLNTRDPSELWCVKSQFYEEEIAQCNS